MGGSNWTFFVPYQPDILKAFEELQQHVLAEQQFEPPRVDQRLVQHMLSIESKSKFDLLREENQLMWPVDEYFIDHEAFEEYRQKLLLHLEQFQNTPTIHSMEDLAVHRLFALDDTGGTHSPLDLDFHPDPEQSTVLPLSAEHLLEHFGTTQPTKPQVERFFETGGFDLSDENAPYHGWQAIYFLIYANGQPHEICFDGATGD